MKKKFRMSLSVSHQNMKLKLQVKKINFFCKKSIFLWETDKIKKFVQIRKVYQKKFNLVVGIVKIPQIDDSTQFQTQRKEFLGTKSDFFQKKLKFCYFFIKFSKFHIIAKNDPIVIKIKLNVF